MKENYKKVPGKFCPRCGRPLYETPYEPGETDEDHAYAYQCLDCDEDFFASEAIDETPANPREFFVETPLGMLRVYAKYENDCADDFPGVYVELMRDEIAPEENLLCCVEYNPEFSRIQTNVYQYGEDEPREIVSNYEEQAEG